MLNSIIGFMYLATTFKNTLTVPNAYILSSFSVLSQDSPFLEVDLIHHIVT